MKSDDPMYSRPGLVGMGGSGANQTRCGPAPKRSRVAAPEIGAPRTFELTLGSGAANEVEISASTTTVMIGAIFTTTPSRVARGEDSVKS
jgi:hypothetical protein